MAPEENAAPEVATEVTEEEAAEVAAAIEEETEAEEAAAEVAETGDAPEEEAEEEAEEEIEATPQAQPEFQPSMTDVVQQRMNAGIAEGNEARRATIRRNQARKREQHAAIHATNRPGPSEPPADEEE
jgi:hypothetical protein